MVTTKISGNHQSLQILKGLEFIDVNHVSKFSGNEKLELTDPLFMHALGTTMQSLCMQRGGYSLSANMVGYLSDFMVVSPDGKNFRYFYNLRYEKIGGEEAQSLESCLNSLDDNLSPRRFLCYRSYKIRISGKEVKNDSLCDVDEEVSGLLSAIIQHECENQDFNFITNYGIEVQVY